MPSEEEHNIEKQARTLFEEKEYLQAASLYETLIEENPNKKNYFWNLGLSLLLSGKEEEAQMSWMAAMVEGDEDEIQSWTDDLINILGCEATHQLRKHENLTNAWVIRQHLREIKPQGIDNLFFLIQLSVALDYSFEEYFIGEDGLNKLILSQNIEDFSLDLLLSTLILTLQNRLIDDVSLEFITVSLEKSEDLRKIHFLLLSECIRIDNLRGNISGALQIGDVYLSFDPNNLDFLAQMPQWCMNTREFTRGLILAERRLQASDSWVEQLFSQHLITKILMETGGRWSEAVQSFNKCVQLLTSINSYPEGAGLVPLIRLVSTSFFAPYIKDEPVKNRAYHNKIGQFLSETLTKSVSIDYQSRKLLNQQKTSNQQEIQKSRKLKIGYISHCFKRHSVGWIVRWLLNHHDRGRFETYGYMLKYVESDPIQIQYCNQFDHACRVGIDCEPIGVAVAQKILEDEIDILIDLDSITLDLTCQIMALKPAPVQVTWLGWDASGIPEVDYYIADSYVLPGNAQEYYSEKIWRLPTTYVAVDGFEVYVPTVSRQSLNIPENSIVYLTTQKGYKRHPETIKLQLEIIKNVSNSYLLIKGFSEQDAVKKYFESIATELGISTERLRFLAPDPCEEVHRANFLIADIVLDTFPYNGATTTLETLWMEIPLVTLVGQQFSARNSYTMLKNVGVEEGIAWTSEEYVQWGVRLGTDVTLRQNVVWKLRQSKKNAPLWNAKAFTKQMEDAYQQMWNIYMASIKE